MLKNRKLIILLSLVLLLGGWGSKSSTKTASTASQNTSNKTQSTSSTAKSSGDNTSSTEAGANESSEQSSTKTNVVGKDFDEIRYDDVEKTLGKPAQISHYKGEDTIIYNVNKDFQFMLIFYEPDDNKPNPELQYISVTCSKVI